MAVPISSPYKELESVNHISYVFKGDALTDTIELRSSYTAGYLHAGYTCSWAAIAIAVSACGLACTLLPFSCAYCMAVTLGADAGVILSCVEWAWK